MAWVDDRIWCHPKFADLSDAAFRLYVNGVAYSSGHLTRGLLSDGMQRTIGASKRTRLELVNGELWDEVAAGVYIHDWDEHNGKRDDRRERDRVRKKEARRSERPSAGTSAGTSTGRSTLAARVEGSEGSEGSDKNKSQAVTEGCSERPEIASEEVRKLIDVSLKEAS